MKTSVTSQPATKIKKQSQKAEAPKLLKDHQNHQPSTEEIATFAYFIWEKNGRPEGHDLDDWVAAEQELKASHSEEPVTA